MNVVLTDQEIKSAVDNVAKEIIKKFPTDFQVLGILCGSFIFVSDLCRRLSALGMNPKVNFVRAGSYYNGTSPLHPPKIFLPPDLRTNYQTLVVDDIADSGNTLVEVKNVLKDFGIKKVMTCTFVVKPTSKIVPDFFCFWLPDKFYVGYGMGLGDEFRCLPYIAVKDQ